MEERPQGSPTPLRRRPGGRSARVLAAVLEATLEELAAVGYSDFSLESIARRAGVHKTTLYRRWGTREALLLDALLAAARQRIPIPDTGSLRADLLEYSTKMIASITTPEMDAIVRTFAAESGRSPALADAGRKYWATRIGLAREIALRAIERGELPQNTDPDLVIEAVLGPLYLRFLMTGERLDTTFVTQIVDLALAGAGVDRLANER